MFFSTIFVNSKYSKPCNLPYLTDIYKFKERRRYFRHFLCSSTITIIIVKLEQMKFLFIFSTLIDLCVSNASVYSTIYDSLFLTSPRWKVKKIYIHYNIPNQFIFFLDLWKLQTCTCKFQLSKTLSGNLKIYIFDATDCWALFTREILTDNIVIKIYCDKNILR